MVWSKSLALASSDGLYWFTAAGDRLIPSDCVRAAYISSMNHARFFIILVVETAMRWRVHGSDIYLYDDLAHTVIR